jgi:hypothetical protein
VAWIGQLCIAGAAPVLLMSRRFRAALKLDMVALSATLAPLCLSPDQAETSRSSL